MKACPSRSNEIVKYQIHVNIADQYGYLLEKTLKTAN